MNTFIKKALNSYTGGRLRYRRVWKICGLRDEKKNEINIKKHGVSFEEASTSFYDDLAIVIPDESIQRRGALHLSKDENNRVLYVSHCERAGELFG